MYIKKVKDFKDIEFELNTAYIVGEEESGAEIYSGDDISFPENLPTSFTLDSPDDKRVFYEEDSSDEGFQGDYHFDGVRRVLNEYRNPIYKIKSGDFAIYVVKYNTEKINDILQITSAFYIPLTVVSDGRSSKYGTFNEELNIVENDQQTLTFSIMKYVNDKKNEFVEHLVNGARIRLVTAFKKIDFIIKTIRYETTESNVKIDFEAESAFSYILSRKGIGYSTIEDQDASSPDSWLFPKTIQEIATKVLQENNVYEYRGGKKQLMWSLHPRLFDGTFSLFPDQLYKYSSQEGQHHTRMSFAISDSNVYNAMVEAALLFGALIEVEYNDDRPGGVINFINKQNVRFKGFRLRPEINMADMSYSNSVEDFCTLMRVYGGEDAYGNYISMLPPMPDEIRKEVQKNVTEQFDYYKDKKETMHSLFESLGNGINRQQREYLLGYCDAVDTFMPSLDSYLYDFDYLEKAGVISAQIKEYLIERFAELRNSNLLLQTFNFVYNELKFQYEQVLTEIEEIVLQMTAENTACLTNEAYSVNEFNRKINDLYQNFLRVAERRKLLTIGLQLISVFGLLDYCNNLEKKANDYQQQHDKYIEEALSYFKESGCDTIEEFEYSSDYDLLGKYAEALEKAEDIEMFTQFPKKIDNNGIIIPSINQYEIKTNNVIIGNSLSQSALGIKKIPLPIDSGTVVIIMGEEWAILEGDVGENRILGLFYYTGGSWYVYKELAKNNIWTIEEDIITLPSDFGVVQVLHPLANNYFTELNIVHYFSYYSYYLMLWDSIFSEINAFFLFENLSRILLARDNLSKRKLIFLIDGAHLDSYWDDNKIFLFSVSPFRKYEICSLTEGILALKLYNRTNSNEAFNASPDEVRPFYKPENGLLYLEFLMPDDFGEIDSSFIDKNSAGDGKNLSTFARLKNVHPIQDFIDYANEEKSKTEEKLLNLSPYILEKMYMDEDQLTYEGLYLSASKEFATYNKPTQEYGATVINYNSLLDRLQSNIDVGDLIYIYDKKVWEERDNSIYLYVGRGTYNQQNIDDIIEIKGTTLNEEKVDVKTEVKILSIKNTTIKTLYGFTDVQEVLCEPQDVIPPNRDIGLYKAIDDTGPDDIAIHHIEWSTKEAEQPLQVTGIKHNLRNINMTLEVENNKAISSVIDKLLMSVRRK